MLIYLPKPAWTCNFCLQQFLEKLLNNPLLHEKLAENINKTINCSDISKSESISDTSLTQNTSYKDDEAAQIPSISLEDILDPHVRYFYMILICKYDWFQDMALMYRSLQVYQRSYSQVGHRVLSDFPLKIVRQNPPRSEWESPLSDS